jgi:hypothetical protein
MGNAVSLVRLAASGRAGPATRNRHAAAAALQDLADWIAEVSADDGRPVLVGFNAPFNWAFVNYYFHHFLGCNPFGIDGIDIKALYMGANGCTWADTKSSKFPLPDLPAGQKHNALADAKYQAELYNYARSLRRAD